MSADALYQKESSLDRAIEKKWYSSIKQLLNDPQTPLNFTFGWTSPLQGALNSRDPIIIQMFLECPRVDWLSVSSDRNFLRVEQEFGIKCEPDINSNGMCRYIRPKKECKRPLDHFYYVNEDRSLEAQQIYEKIIAEVVKWEREVYGPDCNLDDLLFETADSIIAFEIALKYSTNLHAINEKGQTLLHVAKNYTVLFLVLREGVDLHRLDCNERDAFMSQMSLGNLESAQLLVRKGANLDFVNFKGESWLTLAPTIDCSLVNCFGAPVHMFEAALKAGVVFKTDYKSYIVNVNVEFASVFRRDLANNLLCLKDVHDFSHGYRSTFSLGKFFEKMSQDKILSVIKNRILKFPYWNDWNDMYPYAPRGFLKKHASELMCAAVQTNQPEVMGHLVSEYEADPKCIIEGKSLLFYASKNDAIKFLVEKDVDPLIEIDGLKFFERDEFLQGEKVIEVDWLIDLLKGLDLFAVGKGGKSLIERLPENASLTVKSDDNSFSFPVSLLSKKFFEVFKEDEYDNLAAIDDAGNTLLHYIATQISTKKFGQVKNIKLSSLKQAKNHAGISAYELMLQNDLKFVFGHTVVDEDEFDSYIADWIAQNGTDFFQRFGATLLNEALKDRKIFRNEAPPPLVGVNLALAEYLITVQKISFEPLIRTQDRLGNEIILSISKNLGEMEGCETLTFMAKKGFQFNPAAFITMASLSYLEALNAFLDNCDNVEPCFARYSESFSRYHKEYSEPFKTILSHEKIRKKGPRGYSLGDYYFFHFVGNSETIQFLQEIGIDARNLIGTGIGPELSVELERCVNMLNWGWNVEDFVKLSLFDRLYNENYKFQDYARTRHSPRYANYESMPLDSVLGDKDCCAICQSGFEPSENVLLTKCKHVFHLDCSKSYILANRKCPYCFGLALLR